MTDIFNFNYEIKCASFDNNNNLYVATSTLVYLYNSSGNAVVSKTFNNIQAMTYNNGKIYLSDLVTKNEHPNLNIYSIIESTLDASLCNPDNIINPENFTNIPYTEVIVSGEYRVNDFDFIALKFNEITVKNDSIYFIISNSIRNGYVSSTSNMISLENGNYFIHSRGVCDIMGSNIDVIFDYNYNYNYRFYSIYGKNIFYNIDQYLFGLSNIVVNYYYQTHGVFKREYVNKFMRIKSDNTIDLIDTSCNKFIFSTITSTGNIYIYETDDTNYYINLYNNSGYQSTVYRNSVDLISGLMSDNRGYAYAIKRNGSYSNIMILNSNIQSPYEIDTNNGNPSPCLNLKPNTYMYRSFQFSNPLNVQFSFDAYLFENCTAYFNFFTDASGSNGGCLCLSTDSSGSGVTTSTSLSTGNKTDNNDYMIKPNEWHTYKITIDNNYNIIWFIDNIRYAPNTWYIDSPDSPVQLNTINLNGINSSNNYCSFISNNTTLLIDNIAILLN